MHRRTFVLSLAALPLAACEAPVTHDTPSGRPEVTMRTSDTTAVRSALINRMLDRGYNVTGDTGATIAFDQPVQNALAAALLGSQYDATPNARITYTLAPTGRTTRVIADMAIVTNPGSAFERKTPMNNSEDSRGVQAMLTEVARRFG